MGVTDNRRVQEEDRINKRHNQVLSKDEFTKILDGICKNGGYKDKNIDTSYFDPYLLTYEQQEELNRTLVHYKNEEELNRTYSKYDKEEYADDMEMWEELHEMEMEKILPYCQSNYAIAYCYNDNDVLCDIRLIEDYKNNPLDEGLSRYEVPYTEDAVEVGIINPHWQFVESTGTWFDAYENLNSVEHNFIPDTYWGKDKSDVNGRWLTFLAEETFTYVDNGHLFVNGFEPEEWDIDNKECQNLYREYVNGEFTFNLMTVKELQEISLTEEKNKRELENIRIEAEIRSEVTEKYALEYESVYGKGTWLLADENAPSVKPYMEKIKKEIEQRELTEFLRPKWMTPEQVRKEVHLYD